jgi:Leucine-rich repeat (LRR) protein
MASRNLAHYHETELLQSDCEVLSELESTLGRIPRIDDIFKSDIPFGFVAVGHQITALALTNHEMKQLPPCIGKLEGVEILDLSENILTGLPEELQNLSNLKELILDANRISKIPDYPSLERLYWGMNQVDTIPDSIWNMKALKYLDLSENRIELIPEQIGVLANLIELNLAGNKLKILPASIGSLSHLKRLLIDTNNLISVPATLGQLKELAFLLLEGNPLNKMAEDEKKALESLKAHGCKFKF